MPDQTVERKVFNCIENRLTFLHFPRLSVKATGFVLPRRGFKFVLSVKLLFELFSALQSIVSSELVVHLVCRPLVEPIRPQNDWPNRLPTSPPLVGL